MRKHLVALTAAAVLLPLPASAATDVSAVAQGTGTLKHFGGTCTAPLAVGFTVRSNQAVVTESWGPGSPGIETCAVPSLFHQYEADTVPAPRVQQCTAIGGLSTPAPYSLGQTGSTYTLQSSFGLCNGKSVVDKVTVTVERSRVLYAHTYSENGVAIITVSASLPRAV